MTIEEQLMHYLNEKQFRKIKDEYIIYHHNEKISPLHIKIKSDGLFMYCEINLTSHKKMPALINRANLYTTYGSFDYDYETQDIYYRSALDLSNRPFSFKQLIHMCNAPMLDLSALEKQL